MTGLRWVTEKQLESGQGFQKQISEGKFHTPHTWRKKKLHHIKWSSPWLIPRKLQIKGVKRYQLKNHTKAIIKLAANNESKRASEKKGEPSYTSAGRSKSVSAQGPSNRGGSV